MAYESPWLSLQEAVEHISAAKEPDPPEALRRACADGNVRARGLVDGNFRNLGPDWWHPSVQVEFAAGRIVKGPSSKRYPIRAITRRHDQLGPEDYQTLEIRGNVAGAAQVDRVDINNIWSLVDIGGNNVEAAHKPDRDMTSNSPPNPSAAGSSWSDRQPPDYDVWDQVDILTVAQAACLWADEQPGASYMFQKTGNSKIIAFEQIITSAISSGRIRADHTRNPLHIIGSFEKSEVSREGLKLLAAAKSLRPIFLFPEDRPNTTQVAAQSAPAADGAGLASTPSETIERSVEHEPDPYRTGLPGRPTAKHLIELELQRRIKSREVLPTLKAEALALKLWFEQNHPTAARPSEKTITNNIRALYRASVPKTPEI